MADTSGSLIGVSAFGGIRGIALGLGLGVLSAGAAVAQAVTASSVVPAPLPNTLLNALPHLSGVRPEARPRFAFGGVRPEARPLHMVRYPVVVASGFEPRPIARDPFLPNARWDNLQNGPMWTRAAMSALEANAPLITEVVPRDIQRWCPGYPQNPPELRRAFWAGMMSALAFYESTHRPTAVGGGNRWFGLLQIYPPTARGYGCRAQTGNALKDAEDNLSCAARIMNVTVPRDRAVALHDGRWRGVAADWGPMTTRSKREAMAAWTRQQSYCQPQPALLRAIRPVARPTGLTATLSTSNVTPAPARPVARVSPEL